MVLVPSGPVPGAENSLNPDISSMKRFAALLKETIFKLFLVEIF